MSDHETVFEEVARDFERTGRWIGTHLPHRHASPHQPPSGVTLSSGTGSAPTPEGNPMSLKTIEADLRNGLADVEAKVHEAVAAVAPHVAEVADVAQQISESTLFQTVLDATLGPADEAAIVALVKRLDTSADAAAAAVSGTTAAAPADEAAAPAEPVAVPVVPAAAAPADS